MLVSDFAADIHLAEACSGDVATLCGGGGGTEPGAVVACLHRERARLSPACAREERQLEVMQVSVPRYSGVCVS
jgi:hypothetical protein